MTLEGALQFLRSINTDPTRYVHIVDMETFRAYSSFYAPGQEEIDTYARFSRASTDYEKGLIRTMQSFFDGTDDPPSLMVGKPEERRDEIKKA